MREGVISEAFRRIAEPKIKTLFLDPKVPLEQQEPKEQEALKLAWQILPSLHPENFLPKGIHDDHRHLKGNLTLATAPNKPHPPLKFEIKNIPANKLKNLGLVWDKGKNTLVRQADTQNPQEPHTPISFEISQDEQTLSITQSYNQVVETIFLTKGPDDTFSLNILGQQPSSNQEIVLKVNAMLTLLDALFLKPTP